MTRKRGLGKGLEALIPTGDKETTASSGVIQVPLADIEPNPRQPRSNLDPVSLQELSDSIREHGVLQPLIVSPSTTGAGYILVAGERRLEASKLAGLKSAPVIVRQADDRLRLEWALVENLQRTDLNPLEAAEGYRQLAEDFELSHEDIATRVGKSRATVTNTLRLLKLSPAVRQALMNEDIHEGHARALLALSSSQAQSAALQTIIKQRLNVRQAEELIRRLSGQRKARTTRVKRTPEETALEDQLRQTLGTRVTLKRGRRGGSLIIHFYSDEELNALVEQLLSSFSEE
jgi:ParB family chromosome partitioning protein